LLMALSKSKSARKAALAKSNVAPHKSGETREKEQGKDAEQPAPWGPLRANPYDAAEAIANEAAGLVRYAVTAPRNLAAARPPRAIGPISIEYAPAYAVPRGDGPSITAADSNAYVIEQAREMGGGSASLLEAAWFVWQQDIVDTYGFADGSLVTDTELWYGAGKESATKEDDPWYIKRRERHSKQTYQANNVAPELRPRAQMGDFLDDQEASSPR
jgi:hypothetical protein